MNARLLFPAALLLGCVTNVELGLAQSDSAASRMRPIGTPSQVDRYRAASSVSPVSHGGVTLGAAVRQTVWMQPQGMNFPNDPGAAVAPPSSGNTIPSTPPFPTGNSTPIMPSTPGPISTAPVTPNRPLPSPGTVGVQPAAPIIPSSSDYAPMQAPELNTQSFARVDNCPLVTQPSRYTASMGYGCGQVLPTNYTTGGYGPVTTSPVTMPAEIPSPATQVPPSAVTVTTTAPPPPITTTTAAPAKPLLNCFNKNKPLPVVQVGQGLWGQPKAYVPGQNCCNWLRYLTP